MKPTVCETVDGGFCRNVNCPDCCGSGVAFTEGEDRWAAYRAHFGIAVTPQRLAFEEALSDCFD